jgi:outer membrane protein assembly factor BamA
MKFCLKIIISILFCISAARGGNISLRLSGSPYFSEKILSDAVNGINSREPDKIPDALLDFYMEKGFPLAVIVIDSISAEGPDIFVSLTIDSGDYVKISKTVFSGTKVTKPEALLIQSRLKAGEKFSEKEANEASDRLYRSKLFLKRPKWEIFKDASGYGLKYSLAEKKYNELMLLGGFSSDEKKRDYSVLAEIKFDNLFGTMRKAAVLWDRSGDIYEKLRLYYKEPFILSFPISTEARFSQNYAKETSLTRLFGAAQSYSFDPRSSVSYGFSIETIYPDSLYSGRLNEIETVKYFGGTEYSTLYDIKPVPSGSGWRVSGVLTSTRIDIKDSVSLNGVEMLFESETLTKISKNIYLDLKAMYNQAVFKENIPDFSRISFGGLLSFRGYREDFFRSDIFLKQSADLIFAADSEDFAFSIFGDLCQFNPGTGNIRKLSELLFLRSYGAGIIYEIGAGQMQVTIGVPEREGFTQSVVHIRYSVRF